MSHMPLTGVGGRQASPAERVRPSTAVGTEHWTEECHGPSDGDQKKNEARLMGRAEMVFGPVQ